jgi:phosphoglycerate-specific signal transduction histidine kinase
VPSQQPNGRQAYALVNQMAEPLTALSAYLRTASHLLRPDPVSSRAELVEIIEKGLVQTERASGILHRLRGLLRENE